MAAEKVESGRFYQAVSLSPNYGGVFFSSQEEQGSDGDPFRSKSTTIDSEETPLCQSQIQSRRAGTNIFRLFDWNDAWEAIQKKREASILVTSTTSTSHKKRRRHQCMALFFGQAIALCASSMNASSYTLNYKYGVRTFCFQMIWVYLILAMHLFAIPKDDSAVATTILVNSPTVSIQRQQYTLPGTAIRLQIPWWIYLGMSLLDVLPNFLTLLSFNFTSLTSTTLLGSLTVPSTMFFSRHILAKVFRPHHVFGVMLCIFGGCLTVWSDLGDVSSASNPMDGDDPQLQHPESSRFYLGDLLAVTAALAYGLGDTVAEYSIKHIDRNEYLGMIGVFGCVLTTIAFLAREWSEVEKVTTLTVEIQVQVYGVLVWYVTSVVLYYIAEAHFLVSSDATLLNLSMQTTNLYAIIFSIMAYGEEPFTLFYVAVGLVVAGVFVYEVGGSLSSGEDGIHVSRAIQFPPSRTTTKMNFEC
jgi:solute carrier family 35 protein F1/2